MKNQFTKLTNEQLQKITGGIQTTTFNPPIEDDRDKGGGRP